MQNHSKIGCIISLVLLIIFCYAFSSQILESNKAREDLANKIAEETKAQLELMEHDGPKVVVLRALSIDELKLVMIKASDFGYCIVTFNAYTIKHLYNEKEFNITCHMVQMVKAEYYKIERKQ